MNRKTPFVLCGFGNVGLQIARHLVDDAQLQIAAISARDLDAAATRARSIGLDVPVIAARDAPQYADVVVECATYDAFRDVMEPAVRGGCHIIAISVGAFALHLDLIDLAQDSGATIHIASGTMPGLDLLRAAREQVVDEVRLETHLLPRSLHNEPYVDERGIDLAVAEREPVLIFDGTAREAAAHFPRHINVVVSLSLAGIGLDRTRVRIYANGRLPGARHRLSIDAAAVELRLDSQNFPSAETNKTSRIVALSVIAALRELRSPLRVGS